MPLTSKGEEILNNMEREYGSSKGEQVFYASKNAGTISGVDGSMSSTGVDMQYSLYDPFTMPQLNKPGT